MKEPMKFPEENWKLVRKDLYREFPQLREWPALTTHIRHMLESVFEYAYRTATESMWPLLTEEQREKAAVRAAFLSEKLRLEIAARFPREE